MRVTMIGHSTLLIEAAEKKILTDPYFGTWGNPAYRRIAPPFKQREDFKSVDVVLVSHNHWDHTDPKLFRCLSGNVPVIAPRESAWITRLKGARNVLGLRAWDQQKVGPLEMTAIPALHVAVTRGYVISAEGRNIYFAGDTYFRDFMKEISRRFTLDLALLPVTTFRIPMTMGEVQAVRAVAALSPKAVIPIHQGIVPRSPILRTTQSAEGFLDRAHRAGLEFEFKILREGDTWQC